jgi:hypothetical protein
MPVAGCGDDLFTARPTIGLSWKGGGVIAILVAHCHGANDASDGVAPRTPAQSGDPR